LPPLAILRGLTYVKYGLSGCRGSSDWTQRLKALQRRLKWLGLSCRPVAVAYADWQRANAPPPEDVCAFAVTHGCGAFLLDTWQKDGRTLLDWLAPETIQQLARCCYSAGVPVALAGSLSPAAMAVLRDAAPDWFAVRGAVCPEARREAAIDADAVRRLAEWLARPVTTAAIRGS
jgi:uncharacterized protein (UPF0264 family)